MEMLIGGIVAALTPYLVKGGEEFAKEVGKESFQKTRQLFELLKSKLSGDKAASSILDEYAKEPVGHQAQFKSVLVPRLESDRELVAQMTALLRSIESKKRIPSMDSRPFIRAGQVHVSSEVTQGNKVNISVTAGRDVHWKK